MADSLNDLFYNYGKTLTKHSGASKYVGMGRFKSFFGVSPAVCSMAWRHLKRDLPGDYNEMHLLWTLMFLKSYNTDSINCSIARCDEKTFRKRVWVVIEKLAFIKVIEWEDRKLGSAPGQTTFTSLDGVDFKIDEPKPFDPKWFSHKFKHAGLRYEIGLSLRKGDIVWAHGGYPCGAYPDLKIARQLFVDFLEPQERAMADDGYNDTKYFLLPNAMNRKRHKRIMSRHETINKRIKHFKILSETYRHDIVKHKLCFHAIVNLTQLIIKYEEPLWSIF